DVLLASAGVVTAVPLLCFGLAARRLRLSTLAFLQYIAPSVQFLQAALFFDEPFTPARQVSFGLIWTALVIYSVDSAPPYRPPARQGSFGLVGTALVIYSADSARAYRRRATVEPALAAAEESARVR